MRSVKLRKSTTLPGPARRGQIRVYAKPDETLETVDDEGNREPVGSGEGGSGIPQGGPLTEPLDTGGQPFTSAANGANTGASVTVAAATVDAGGTVEITAGEHPDGGAGAYMGLFGAESGAGGEAQFHGGNGIAGAAGGAFSLVGGNGDDGHDAGAMVQALAGDGEGNPGLVRLRANNVLFNVKQAANVALLNFTVSDPPEQTEVQAIADAVDALIASLIAGGWMAAS